MRILKQYKVLPCQMQKNSHLVGGCYYLSYILYYSSIISPTNTTSTIVPTIIRVLLRFCTA